MPDKEHEDELDDLDRLDKWMETEGITKAADIFGQKDWVEKLVRRTFSKAMPMAVQTVKPRIKPELFETHHFVIIKCHLDRTTKASDIQVFVRADRIKIMGLSGDEDTVIKLPAIVDPYDSRALCRDRVLQIKVRKRTLDRMYHEVDIRF